MTRHLGMLLGLSLALCACSTSSPPRDLRPITEAEFAELRASALLTEDDYAALRRSAAILEPRVEEILDVWYGFVASQPHLLASFSNGAGKPDQAYLAAVRKRFGQWILDTARADYDADWLAYQHQIGLRHHRIGKNQTDGADAVDHIAFRHLVALTSPITITLRPFLRAEGVSEADARAMEDAWFKAVLVQVVLWSRPYVQDGDY